MKEIELIGKRTLNTKHFLQENGTIVAKMYDYNVHYFADGKYQEIDNTLIKENDCYVNKNNDYKVFFNKQGNKSLIKMEKNGKYLDVKIKDSNTTEIVKPTSVSKIINSIKYLDVLEDVDVEYKTLPSKVKETIVLKTNKYQKITFLVDTNLSIEVINNKIVAKDKEDIIFIIDPPYMQDSSGVVNENVAYQLINASSGKCEIDLILDSEWLFSSKTLFPVFIDPTITNYTQESSVIDTYIFEGDTEISRSNQPILKAGVERINNSNVINRTLIKFDLPVIGTGSEIISATLQLVGYPEVSGQPNRERVVEIHRITERWDESTANWANMNNKFDSKIETLQFISRSTVLNNELVPSISYDYNDITDLVKHWYKDTENFGILIKSVEEEYFDDNYPAFYSKDNNVEGDNPKPLLEITYRNQNGLESYLDYQQQVFSNGSTYVNTYNGNLVGLFQLGTVPGTKIPMQLNLIYNTNDVVLSGNGFKFDLMQTIKKVTIDEQIYYEYEDSDGTLHYFYNSNGTYVDEDGLGLTLEIFDNTCNLRDNYNNKKIFSNINNVYYLTRIEDSNGNYITITLNNNNRITQILDSDSNEIDINYYSENIIKIIGSEFEYTLNSNNNKIVSIITELGTMQFNYDLNNLISEIIDPNGTKMCYQYYSETPYRVKKIINYGLNDELGQTYDFEYGFNTTKITDYSGKVNTLIFNSYGNLISRNSLPSENDISNAYSLEKGYNNTLSYKNNKLAYDDIPVKYVKNFLKNTSFETDVYMFSITNDLIQSFSTDCFTLGYRSLKLLSNSDNQVACYNIDVPKGKYYTFSCDLKNNDSITLVLSYMIENETIEEHQVINSSNDFERQDLTIFYDSNATSSLSIKIVLPSGCVLYVDNIQLEEGEVANRYNIIENSDFSDGINDWTLTASKKDFTHFDEYGFPLSIDVPVSNVFEVVQFNNQNALKIKMNPIGSSTFSKEFPISGNAGDVYTISFWIKNYGILGNDHYVYNDVRIYFHPVDESHSYCVMSSPQFLPNSNWQYVTFKYDALDDFDSIRVIFSQISEANEMYITNITFTKDTSTNYYKYDENGNLTSIQDASGREDAFNYDDKNQLISSVNPIGANFKYEYDSAVRNRLLSALSPGGVANKIKYDENGNPISIKTLSVVGDNLENGNYKIRLKGTEKYLKFMNNKLIMLADSCSNNIWNFNQINNSDNEYKISHPAISYYKLTNDSDKLIIDSVGSVFELEQTMSGAYYIKYKYIEEITGYENYKYLKVDENDSLIFTSIILNDNSFEFYLENADSQFIETDSTYTSDGRFVSSVTDSNFNTIQYITNNSGLVTSIIDAKGNITTYQYNNKDQLSSISKGNRTVQYQYNNSNLLSQIIQGSTTYNFEYDNFLNNQSVKIGSNIVLATNNYNSRNGKLSSIIYGNDDTISYDYDIYDRVKTVHKMDSDYNFKYDSSNNLAKIIFGNSIIKYTYDSVKRLNEYINNEFRIKYNYNKNDCVTKKIFKLNNITNEVVRDYDLDDNITAIQLDNTSINYIYDKLDRLTELKINDIYSVKFDYLSTGKRTSKVVKSIECGNDLYLYKYDNLYNITDIYYNGNLKNKYYYDVYNQLIKEEDIIQNESIEYVYDNTGNILSKVVKNLQDDSIISSIQYSYGNSNWPDQLTAYNNVNITYDVIGNPLAVGDNINMSWINGRQLSSYNDTIKNLSITYDYDINGIRTKKTVNNSEILYYLDNDNIIYEQRPNMEIYYLYDLTGLIGLKYNNSVYYYIKNLQDDIIGIMDSNFNKIATYEYDSWGKVISIKDIQGNEITSNNHIAIINPFRYRSYYYDEETGLYYINHRYYNPDWKRFINADSYFEHESLCNNLYLYCSNNPVLFKDISGKGFAIALPNIGQAINDALNAVSSVVNSIGAQAAGLLSVAVTGSVYVGLAVVSVYAITQLHDMAKDKAAEREKKSKNPKKNKNENKYNVYTLRDPVTNTVEYVGRTEHLNERETQHRANPVRAHLRFQPEAVGVNYFTARGVEQALIIKCRTLNRNKEMPINNQINGVSEKNVNYDFYWDLGLSFVTEHEISCN